jgi:hypothetical protein
MWPSTGTSHTLVTTIQETRVKAEIFAEAGFYMASDCKSQVCQFCDLEITSLEGWKELSVNEMLQQHRKLSPHHCTLVENTWWNRNVPMGEHTHIQNHKHEAQRLFSLLRSEVQHFWDNVNPYDLARWGFYYAGNKDNVRYIIIIIFSLGFQLFTTYAPKIQLRSYVDQVNSLARCLFDYFFF